MIICAIEKEKGSNQMSFDIDIKGNMTDVLMELMNIESCIIEDCRAHKISDEDIEKQLVNCILGGFRMCKDRREL